jgi:hypothetical protein
LTGGAGWRALTRGVERTCDRAPVSTPPRRLPRLGTILHLAPGQWRYTTEVDGDGAMIGVEQAVLVDVDAIADPEGP